MVLGRQENQTCPWYDVTVNDVEHSFLVHTYHAVFQFRVEVVSLKL
jgi:hypothetical protein